jgi:CRISP-associated protein Cas1
MLRKTIEIATPGARLSVAHRQLVIERPEQPRATLPIEDLGVVIVDDRRASYSQAVFIELMSAGVTLIVTGHDHLPLGMMLPFDGHHVLTERHRAQVAASEPTRKRIWQALVGAKLRQQAVVLSHFMGDDAGLSEMARRVRSGDPDNLEAQGAQRYWPRLFGAAFRRDRSADGVNALLNYGYVVIRASLARAIVASGLIPSLGVFHKGRANPFCLADDLLEPFRPYVDWRVKLMILEQGAAPSLEMRETRAALLGLFNEGVRVDGRRMPLLLAVERAASSLARALTGDELKLSLPAGLPVELEAEDARDGP